MIIPFLGFLLFIFALAFVVALFSSGGGIFALLLEIESKQETLEFIGLGMGSVLATIGAVVLHQRAEAAMKNAEAMTKNAETAAKNNTLTEEGNIQERFKAAVQSLGHAEPSVRIAAFYQFYHLAEGHSDKNLRRSIMDILCAHLRQITRDDDGSNREQQNEPTEECQSLLDVLFKNPQRLFADLPANLRGIYIGRANMRLAEGQINFELADVRRVDFGKAKLSGSSFLFASIGEANFNDADLSGASFMFATGGDTAYFHDIKTNERTILPHNHQSDNDSDLN